MVYLLKFQYFIMKGPSFPANKCEEQLPNRPAMKGHMHNEHHMTIFEDIDIDKHGGFKWYRYPGKYYGH